MFVKRVRVAPNHRMIVMWNGNVHGVLRVGTHTLFNPPFVNMQTETHRVDKHALKSRWTDALLRHTKLTREHFNVVETNSWEVAMISLNGDLLQVLPPARRAVYWKDMGPLSVELVNIVEIPAIGETMLTALERREHGGWRSFDSEDSATANLLETLLEGDERRGRWDAKS